MAITPPRDFAEDFSIPTPELTQWIDFSVGFAGTRTVFAHTPDPCPPLAALLRSAAQHSLNPALGPFTAPADFAGHPMWPALARHMARVSTPDDRALLEDLARHPETAPTELLQWGLRYWVRGDVMLEDGSVLTLDEIWAGLRERYPEDIDQLADLPLLDDMPPDVEIDLDALEPAQT